MTDEERTNHFCSQMKCKEPRGHKLSFTAPHFKCWFLSFHWNLLAFLGKILHAPSQVSSFFCFFVEVKYLRSPCRRENAAGTLGCKCKYTQNDLFQEFEKRILSF